MADGFGTTADAKSKSDRRVKILIANKSDSQPEKWQKAARVCPRFESFEEPTFEDGSGTLRQQRLDDQSR